jgi:ATP-dependent DNA helicase RecQ
MNKNIISIESILKENWGFNTFRGIQKEAITSVLEKQDTLTLMPTGGGKSICFQVAGLALGGITLVISPLIALMQDQVTQLTKRGIKAITISGANNAGDIDRLLDNCIYGDIKFLYVSPERLSNELFLTRLAKMKVGLIAVDEAHCISQWGYDFRPAYLNINTIRPLFPEAPIIALTASATKEVQQDICTQLEFKANHNIISQSFERQNLVYVAYQSETKEKRLLEILSKVNGSAVVYTRNRKNTKLITDFLKKRKISADYYHAGLANEDRSRKQINWINGETRVIVATNAFGMGIDKSDVRLVIHLDVPESPEAYFQEAGRAGRDGKKAYAVLLWNTGDKTRIRSNWEQKYPHKNVLNTAYQKLCSILQIAEGELPQQLIPFNITAKAAKLQLSVTGFLQILKSLEWCGFITVQLKGASISQVHWLSDVRTAQNMSEKSELLAFLIRSNGNFFEFAINVNEKLIAKHLKISEQTVSDQLQKLHDHGWINYTPANNNASLQLMQPRVPEQYFAVPAFLYKTLKVQDENRMNFMLNYLDSNICRSQQLLSYFGEKDITPCGKCEICQAYGHELTAAQRSSYLKTIKKHLEQAPDTKPNLISLFKPADQQAVKSLIRVLLDEQTIALTSDEKIHWKGN